MTWPPGQPHPPRGTPQPPMPMPMPMPMHQPLASGTHGRAPRKARRGPIVGLAVLGVVLVAAVVAAIVGAHGVEGTAVVADPRDGDCIADVPTDSGRMTLPTVDCTEAHDGEVFSVLEMHDPALPDEEGMRRYLYECQAEMSRNGPFRWPHLSAGLFVLRPTQETWDRGDRSFTCIAKFSPKLSARRGP